MNAEPEDAAGAAARARRIAAAEPIMRRDYEVLRALGEADAARQHTAAREAMRRRRAGAR